MAAPLTFPYEVLPIRSFQLDIVGQVISGGITQAGQQQVVNASGGGLWSMQLGFPRWSKPDQIRAWRAVQYGQRGGVVPINVSICDLRQAPLPPGYAGSSGVPHSDGTPFSDGTLYASDIISAALNAPLALRATSAVIALAGGSVIRGGEFFSMAYGDGYNELKVITSVEDLGAGMYEVAFLPPMRAAHAAGEAIAFDHPTGTFRLAQQDAMSMALEYGRFGTGQAAFIEHFV